MRPINVQSFTRVNEPRKLGDLDGGGRVPPSLHPRPTRHKNAYEKKLPGNANVILEVGKLKFGQSMYRVLLV